MSDAAVSRFRLRIIDLVRRGLPQEVADRIWLYGNERLLASLEAATDADLKNLSPITGEDVRP